MGWLRREWGPYLLVGMGALGLVSSCGGEEESELAAWSWNLPPDVPQPLVPDENPMSAAKVQLGRMLFYDPALSANVEQSCASCHQQAKGFAEARAVSVGSTGEAHPRNAQALVNIAYVTTLTWANPLLRQLEAQIPIPIFGEDPVELGLVSEALEGEVLNRFRDSPAYVEAFALAFPEDVGTTINKVQIVQALASFVRSLTSFSSPYDRYLAGDTDALSPDAIRGLELFFSERFECFHCHGGFLFAGTSVHEGQPFADRAFFNTGLYNLTGEGGQTGDYPYPNLGLYDITEQSSDMGSFRPPSLRNVEVTGPYMHDGSVASLEEVIAIYERGGRLIEEGPNQGDGAENPHKSGFVRGFSITEDERNDILSFLRSLTDAAFLTNPAHADPGIRALPRDG
ncbi:MAG: di-heme enzyme [Myxococcales bacterium]|nr:di-heme enzyme [Myxococcales bacterium]